MKANIQLKQKRIVVGVVSSVFFVLWFVVISWSRGMSAFGTSHRTSMVVFQEFFPPIAFGLVLGSVIYPNRTLLHIVAVVVAPCLALSLYLTARNPYIGAPLAVYFGLWFNLYYHAAWKKSGSPD